MKLVNILHLKLSYRIMLFEMGLLIVLSVETASIAIFSCFSIINDIFLIARFPTIDTASIPITAGAPLPFFRYNPFPISFCTPVIVSPDKDPTHKAGKTVPVRNGINPAYAGKNSSSIFMLWSNCVFLHSYCHAFLIFICLH